jgi:hypothetical protein
MRFSEDIGENGAKRLPKGVLTLPTGGHFRAHSFIAECVLVQVFSEQNASEARNEQLITYSESDLSGDRIG